MCEVGQVSEEINTGSISMEMTQAEVNGKDVTEAKFHGIFMGSVSRPAARLTLSGTTTAYPTRLAFLACR